MKKEDIKLGHVYLNKKTKKIGVVFGGFDYGCIEHSIEIAMIYQGDDKKPEGAPPFDGTLFKDLERYELKPKDILTDKYVKTVCKPGSEETCAYLIASANGFECAKVLGDNSVAHTIDDRLEKGTIRAKGNNCGGRYNPKHL
jgi:hypothetical protein